MTLRSVMLTLTGSLILTPIALAKDPAAPRPALSYMGSESRSTATSVASLSLASSKGQAVKRGGGGSTSSKSGSSVSSRSRDASSKDSGRSSEPSDARSKAEQRHPQAGTGRADDVRPGSRSYPYSYRGYPYYYYPGGGWGSYWWPYGSYGWYGGYWGYPWGVTRHYYPYRETSAIRVLVDPSEARVYVDGYYAGNVDDFDGLFQRLYVSPGPHEITFKLEGYRSHRVKIYVSPVRTLKLHFRMERGSGESVEDLGGAPPEVERAGDPGVAQGEGGLRAAEDPAGKLRLRVKPSDASVYVDGAFRGTAREAATLPLPPGRHQIEIVRPGYRTVEREVEVVSDESTELTIELEQSAI